MPRIAVAYIVVSGAPKTSDFVARFVSTWQEFPPGIDTDVLAICNGGVPNTEQAVLLSQIHANVFPRSNEGWDLGGHIEASKWMLLDYEMVLYLGESVYFHRAGWLKRLVDTWNRCGVSMLGPFATHVIRAHLLTTAFATSPKLLREYPLPVTDRKSRMEFEHGERAFWRLVKRKYPVKLVTFDGAYDPPHWRLPENILWKGTQENCLMFCNHTQRWAEADKTRKRSWTVSANRPFK